MKHILKDGMYYYKILQDVGMILLIPTHCMPHALVSGVFQKHVPVPTYHHKGIY